MSLQILIKSIEVWLLIKSVFWILTESQAATSEHQNGVLLEPEKNISDEEEVEHHDNDSGLLANYQYQQFSSAQIEALEANSSLNESQPSTSANGTAEERQEPLICDSCGVSFSDVALLNIHSTLHKERPFNCQMCGSSFKMMKCLMKHQKFHATEDLCIQFETPLHEEEFIVQLETCDAVDPSLHTLEVTTPGKCESQQNAQRCTSWWLYWFNIAICQLGCCMSICMQSMYSQLWIFCNIYSDTYMLLI